MNDYQIFANETAADTVNTAINALFGYPNGATTYRKINARSSDGRVACKIGYKLVDKCAGMTAEERLVYYDENNLVNIAYLKSEGFVSEIEL